MRKGQRTREQNICACGCGHLAPIKYTRNGRVQCYTKFVPGHGNKDWGKRMKALPVGALDHLPLGSTRIHFSTPTLPYRQIKVGPGGKGWRFEHRHLMEKHLGRALLRSEHVHHKNHDTLDNRLENLQLLTHSDHSKLHHKFEGWSKKFSQCKGCKTRERKHEGHGLCTACFQRWQYKLYGPPKRY